MSNLRNLRELLAECRERLATLAIILGEQGGIDAEIETRDLLARVDAALAAPAVPVWRTKTGRLVTITGATDADGRWPCHYLTGGFAGNLRPERLTEVKP